ncbi:28S ribosomal protein S17, mitochondrial-like [Limulus polyphemus]|uniref:28S ribosomal protein S17, mitochondrial-like n=1 Tax=Limulus polyphemus TaxID=6850 RepID=A0ABM1BGK7_LIMPO|nr:28S ribosomal protein S17, mitochondrial-like [Limulus polyphemus]
MATTVSRTMLMFGQCVNSNMRKTAKISVMRMELNLRILKHFKERSDFYAYDPEEKCKPGDYVLIRELSEPISLKVKHKVEKIVYELGNIIDPITGQRCFGKEFIEDIDRESELFGLDPPYKKFIREHPDHAIKSPLEKTDS